jgi:hypothetical protein
MNEKHPFSLLKTLYGAAHAQTQSAFLDDKKGMCIPLHAQTTDCATIEK